MKFSEMPYSRPQLSEIEAATSRFMEAFAAAETVDDAVAAYRAYADALAAFMTTCSIAQICMSIDTRDEFYEAEVAYIDEIMPNVEALMHGAMSALLASPLRAQLEERLGSLLFLNYEIMQKSFSPEIVENLQAENKLCTEYSKLLASAQIPFEGELRTLSQLAPFKQDADDALRLRAWKADASFYVENGSRLDELYDELTRIRHDMAKKLGYENYVKLGYYRMQRNCYDAEDVERFHQAVIKHIVPVATRLYREQAERIGAPFPLNYADMALMFRSGNPMPKGTPDDILEHGRKFYHELSPETAEFIDFMFENELFDVLSRTGKSGGGYCDTLVQYKSPFIFANFNGTSHDVEVMTHEAGHAFAAYVARDIFPYELQSPSLESCEIHSMAMEFFAWPWQEGWFGEQTDKFYYSHLAGALTFIPYGTMVDHFQHIVYERPEMTPAERHDVWKELLKTYMPWVALGDEIPFYGEGKAWQRQSHIYQRPFYYIDYCLAQTVALQFWAAARHDARDAWSGYLKLVSLAGTRTFTELVAAAGLESPFGEEALSNVAREAVQWLDSVDMTKIK
ncbi:MAG: M3 family oligoendopeptidase [Clostridia bacterium]|nr:M3 family oligoendopeptidase [Clostridia bacterium]